MNITWTADEMMTVAAARRLGNDITCFVGIGLPSAAANLARLTHAPDVVLIYESGTLGTRPDVLPLSIGELHAVLDRIADLVPPLLERADAPALPLIARGIDVGFRQEDLCQWMAGRPDWLPA